MSEKTKSNSSKKMWLVFVGVILILLLGFAAVMFNAQHRNTVIEALPASETADIKTTDISIANGALTETAPEEQAGKQAEPAEEVDPYALYADVLDMIYCSYKNGWSELDEQGQTDVLDPDSVSYKLYLGNEYDLDTVGYAFVDLDENGIPELLVAPVEPYEEGEIFDIYSVDDDGTLLHLASGGDRYRYCLCDDLSLRFEGSSSAALSYIIRYRLDTEKHMLLSTDTLIYDGFEDKNQPYFYTDEPYSPDDYTYDYSAMTHLSSYEEWIGLYGDYTTVAIDVTPFAQYRPDATAAEAADERTEDTDPADEETEDTVPSDLAAFQRFVSNFDESATDQYYASCRYMLYDCNNDDRDELMVVYVAYGSSNRVLQTAEDDVYDFASYGCADFYTVNDSGEVELLYRTPAHLLAGSGDFEVIEVQYNGEMRLAYYQYTSEDWDHDVYELLRITADTLVEDGSISVYYDGSANYRVLADIYATDEYPDEAMSKAEFIR